MKQIPDRRFATVGRLPSDMDGDEQRITCADCGRTMWKSEALTEFTPTRGTVQLCRYCAGPFVLGDSED